MRSWSPVLVLLAVSLAGPAFATRYEFDPAHSAAQFSVRHMMVTNVKGELSGVAGSVNLDEKDVSKSSMEATLDTATINTREPKRDGHLKSPDFLDVAKYPTLTFKSTRVEKGSPNHLKVTGDLTIRGVTKPVVLDVEYGDKEVKDLYGSYRRGASATTKINRKDFGLVWNKALEGGGVLVGDEVSISLDVELQRKDDAKTVTGQR